MISLFCLPIDPSFDYQASPPEYTATVTRGDLIVGHRVIVRLAGTARRSTRMFDAVFAGMYCSEHGGEPPMMYASFRSCTFSDDGQWLEDLAIPCHQFVFVG